MFICLDVESTGLNPQNDHLIEIAIVRFDYENILEEWSSLIKSPVPVPEFTKRLTGIDDEMLKDAPLFEDLKNIIKEKIGDLPIMGHFITFDTNFLRANGMEIPNAELDTCQLSQAFLHAEASYSLEVLAEKLNILQENAHRALDDVKANIDLFWKICEHIKALKPEEKTIAQELLQKSSWEWSKFILPVLEKTGGQKIESIASAKNIADEKAVNLQEVNLPETPFLFEDPSLTLQDILDYSLTLNGKTLLSVPNLELMPSNEEIGIIKHPNDYLDEKRLEAFLDKKSLNSSETMLGLKLKLWALHSEAGEKSEIKIHKDEKDLWFDICGQETEIGSSFYAKAFEKAKGKELTIIDHNYFLKDKARQNPLLPETENLVLAETEALVNTLEDAWHIRMGESKFLSALRLLKNENPNLAEILDNIAGKVSILYGFIGMEIQRYGTPNDPRHPIVIEGHHRNTPEWNRVVKASASIKSAVSALGDSIKESPVLDDLSKHINYLETIMSTEGPLLWIAKTGDEMPLVHSFPQNTAPIFKERIWKSAKNLHLFARQANLDDDFAFIKKELFLPENLTCLSSENKMQSAIIFAKNEIPNPKDPRNIQACVTAIADILPETKGNIMILVTAMAVAEQFFYKFKNTAEEDSRKLLVQNMNGSLGKIVKMSEQNPEKNIFVGNEVLLETLINEKVPLNLLAVHKLPFAFPDSPIQKARSAHYENTYKEFSMPQAKLRHQRNLSRFFGNNHHNKFVLILDPRLMDLF